MFANNNTRAAHFYNAAGAYLFTANHNITRRNVRNAYHNLMRSVCAQLGVESDAAMLLIVDAAMQRIASGEYDHELIQKLLLVSFAQSPRLLDVSTVTVTIIMSDDGKRTELLFHADSIPQAA